MLGIEPRSKKPSDRGRLNDPETGFVYIREELENTILDNGMESQHYIVGLSNNTNTLTFFAF